MVAKALDFVRAEQRLAISEVAEELGIHCDLCQATLTEDLALIHVSFSVHLMAADSGAKGAPLVCYL